MRKKKIAMLLTFIMTVGCIDSAMAVSGAEFASDVVQDGSESIPEMEFDTETDIAEEEAVWESEGIESDLDTEEDIFSSEEIETDSDVEGEIFSSGEENEITSEPEVESEDEEQVEAFSAESYMAAEIGDISNGYHIGNLTVPLHTDTNGNVFIGIDNSLYPVSDNFDFSNIQGIIGSDNKEIVYVAEENVIHEAYACSDMMVPSVNISTDPKELVYKNGKLNSYSFKINVRIFNRLKKKYDFLPSSIIDSLSTTLTNLKVIPSSGDLNFGKDGFWIFGNDITEINETLNQPIGCGEEVFHSYVVQINKNYKLLAADSFLGVKAEISTTNGEARISASVSVGNLDYQSQQAEEKKAATRKGKAISAAKNSINNNAERNVAFDAFLSNYLTNEQIRICQNYVYAYAGTMMAATTGEYSSTDKIMDKVFPKLGIDKRMLTKVKKLVGTTTIKFNDIKAVFTVDMGSFSLGNSSAYAAMGKIKYSLYKGYKVTGGTGMITYTDVKTFVEDLKDIADSTIKDLYNVWGKNADKIAAYLTEGTIIETLRNNGIIGSFSGNVYKVLTEPTRRYTKTLIECPVDIEVYDFSGNLCGVIKDNKVDTAYNDIYMYVDDDKKYVYLSANDYYLKLVGNDSGLMDYAVEEYNYDGSLVRKIDYKDVPLNSGKQYTATIPDAGTFPTEIYDLMDSSGNEINATLDSMTESQSDDERRFSWNLSDDGILSISGNVGMDYAVSNPPWYDQRDKITSVVIEEGITSITGAFCEHQNLREIVIPSSVKTIGRYTFDHCLSLESVAIPDSVKKIDEYAFSNCKKIENIIIPDSVTEIGDDAFAFCTNLNNISIGKGVTSIGDFAFRETALVNVVFPENVVSVSDVFYGCEKLVSVTVGSGMVDGLEECRNNSDSFKGYIVSENNPAYYTWDGILFNKEKTELLVYPRGRSNTSYRVPDTVSRIGNNGAFGRCRNIKTIIIPPSVTYIDYNTFDNCSNLENLIFQGDSPEFIGNGSFDDVASDFTIYYPPNNSTWTPFPIHYDPVTWPKLEQIKLMAYCGILEDGTVNLKHEYTKTVVQEVSCTQDGLYQYKCIRCGNIYTEKIPSLGHLWGSITVTKQATCTEAGIKSRTCEKCGVSETTSIPAIGHSYHWKTDRNATCGKDGQRHQECTRCKVNGKTESIRATGKHSFGSWTIRRQATALVTGILERKCRVCGGAKQTQTTAKLEPAVTLNIPQKKTLPLTFKKTFTVKVSKLTKGDSVKSWSSSNKNVVTVSGKGKLTAKRMGTAKITVKLRSGKTTWFKVKVQKANVKTSSLRVVNKSTGKTAASKIVMKRGKRLILTSTVSPVTSRESIVYSSSNKKVATVSSKGTITAKRKGTSIITVKSGRKYKKIRITVR